MKNISQQLYNQILEVMPIPCVDVCIVNQQNQILLIRRKDEPEKNMWWVPGGRVFKGEMMKDTAKRKALEETGINCEVSHIIHTAETVFSTGPNNIPVHSVNVCYLAYPTNKDIIVTLDNHSSTYMWIKELDSSWQLHPYVQSCLLGAGIRYPIQCDPTNHIYY